MEMRVGDIVWHPCSIDIMEHKVISVHNYENDKGAFTQVVTRATHNIGACGKVECVLDVRKNRIVFVELVDEDNVEYASGLQDFIEGEYFINRSDARKAFYKTQHTIAWSNVEKKKRLLNEAEKRLKQIDAIIKEIEEERII